MTAALARGRRHRRENGIPHLVPLSQPVLSFWCSDALGAVRRGQKTGYQSGQRSEADGKLNPWSQLPLETVVPFRDFRQQAMPPWPRRHCAEPFFAPRIDSVGGRKRLLLHSKLQGRNLAPSAAGPFVWPGQPPTLN
jgi:hypothetical protein